MAEIKPIKINSAGFEEELDSASDQLTLSGFTADSTNGFSVTGGATMTENIAFNAVTDTIAGIQNQNLVDKTASETISADWTIATTYNLTLTDAPSAGTDAVNKSYVDGLFVSTSWQDPIIDQIDFTTAEPGAPTVGDRYINTVTGNSSGTTQAMTAKYIYEWNGATWTETVPSEGFTLWDESDDAYYNYNNAGVWVKIGSVITHNNLSGLQGGTTNEYYHMTSAEDTWLGTVSADISAANVADLSDNETVTGNWTFSGESTLTSGVLNLPTAADGATPIEGSVYWDGTSDALFIYDGSAYVNVTNSGSANSVQNTYTAGAGGIAAFDAVYISAADTVLKADASAIATAKLIGFAPAAITAAADGAIQENGVLAGALTGATAGDVYYLSETPGLISTTRPTASAAVVYRVGIAKNATDLHVQTEFVTIRA